MRAVPSYKRICPYKTQAPCELRTLIIYEIDSAHHRPLEAEVLELDPVQFIIYRNSYSFVNAFFRYFRK